MLINCYYYAPHNHALLSRHLDYDLEHMAEMGTDIVSFCVQEEQLVNWHQQRIRNVVDRIHAHGMKAHAVPNRWAGLVAGWLDGFSRFSVMNQDALIHDITGKPIVGGEMASCVNNPKVSEHIKLTLAKMFENFDFDGLIWDEPHSQACFCRYCFRLSDEPSHEWYHARFAKFIDRMSKYAKELKPDVLVSLFVQPTQDSLLFQLLKCRNLDYLGSDGHVRGRKHQMHRMKKTIFEAHSEFYPLIKNSGRKTAFLLDAQRHRDEDLDDYLLNLDRAFSLPMDQLMYYYSAHEMSLEKEGVFNERTWAAAKALSKRQ